MTKKRKPNKPPKKDVGKQQPKKTTDQNKEEEEKKKKGAIFDSIFRQNAPDAFRGIIEMQLNVEIKSYERLEQLPDKHVVTLVRETDFCYETELIETKGDGTKVTKKVILHLEFQADKEYEMIYRMAEYHGILFNKYRMPIKHVVIYLGTNKVNMPAELKSEEVFTGFDLINLWEIDVNVCLSSQVPEVVILAILANYPKEQVEEILRSIIERLKVVTKGNKRDFSQFRDQLGWLVRLRDKNKSLIKILYNMPIFYDVEEDLLYRKGFAKGEEKGEAKAAKEIAAIKAQSEAERKRMEAEKEADRKRMEAEKEAEKIEIIKGLISSNALPISNIARIFKVSLSFVEELKKGME